MDISQDVYFWALSRKEAGYTIPRIVDHFFLMEEEEMASFFAFRDEMSLYDGDNVLLPNRPSLKQFCEECNVLYKTSTKYGITVAHIPMEAIDPLCDWLKSTQ